MRRPYLLLCITAALAAGQATFIPGTTSGNGLPAGTTGDIQKNLGGLFAAATGQDLFKKIYPAHTYTVDGGTFASIRDAKLQCDTDIGASNYGNCEIFEKGSGTEIMNVLPWDATVSNKHIINLHIGNKILKLCDSATVAGTDGQVCTAPFSLATGQGTIDGLEGSLSLHSTGSAVLAGAIETGVPLMVWGYCGNAGCTTATSTGVDVFGARIENLLVDGNCNVGMSGVENSSAQERSVLRNVHVRNVDTVGIWLSSIRASNSLVENNEVDPGTCLTAATIPMLIENAGSPRPIRGVTLNGLNGLSVSTSTATFTASTGVISGLTGVDTTKIGPSLGPGSAASYVYLNTTGVTGWQGVFTVTASSATSITVSGLPGTAVNGTGGVSGTAELVPSYALVVCSGNCAAYGGAGSGGGQAVQVDGLHVQHVGIGAEIVSTAAQSVALNQPTASGDTNTVVQFENNATLRAGLVQGLLTGGATTAIVDNSKGRTVTGTVVNKYSTGAAATASAPVTEQAEPLAMVESAAPQSSTHCVAGLDTVWADSTAHGLSVCNNGDTAQRIPGTLAPDQQTGLSATRSATLATSPPAGLYSVVFVMETTAANSGTGNVVAQVTYTSSQGAQVAVVPALPLLAGGHVYAKIPIQVASGNIAYTATYIAGTGQYNVTAWVVREY